MCWPQVSVVRSVAQEVCKHALKLTRITRFGRLELELFFVILVNSPKAWPIDGCSNKDAGKVERETPDALW